MSNLSNDISKKEKKDKKSKKRSRDADSAAATEPQKVTPVDSEPPKKKSKKSKKNTESSDAEEPTVATVTSTTSISKSTTGTSKKKKANNKDEDSKPITKESPVSSESSEPISVYLKGMPFEWQVPDVKAYVLDLAKNAKVQIHGTNKKNLGSSEGSSTVNTNAIRASVWDDNPLRTRGFCHVDFDTKEIAEKFIQYAHDKECILPEGYEPASNPNGKKSNNKGPVKKFWLNATLATTRAGDKASAANHEFQKSKLPKTSSTLFVKNLPYEATETEIAKVFASNETKTNGIERVRVAHVNGRSKGFCYIDFESRALAIEQLKREKIMMNGRRLIVDAATGEKKEGYHYRDEAWEGGLAG